MKNKLFIVVTCIFFNYLQAQMIISNSFVRDLVGGSDSDIQSVFGLMGCGSLYNQNSQEKQNVAAAGGFVGSIPLRDLITNGRLNSLSIIAKYNMGALKNLILKDSLYNISNISNDISKQIFGFDNGNNLNFGLRYIWLNRKDNGNLHNFNIFADCNITKYSIRLDTVLYSNDLLVDPYSNKSYKMSSGFTLINPLLGISYDFSAKFGADSDPQYLGINLSLAGSASIIYETDKGKDYVSSWAYTLFHNQALQKDFSLNNKINQFYCAYFRFNIYLNDINCFIVLQKNFVNFSNSQLELSGINNRNMFFNWGITFSPSLIKFHALK